MREIKFRFWKDGLMKHWNDFPCLDMCDWLNKNDVVAMQFTGLKDKNGKEIYEGDIAQEMYESGQHSMTSPSVVTWEGSGFVFKTENAICREPELCEVIGNLYENPELLK